MTSSEFVQQRLQLAVSDKIVLYLSDDRHFTHFSKDAEGKKAFELCVEGLANKNYCFYVLSASSRVKTAHVKTLWQGAQQFSIVFVILKHHAGHENPLPFVVGPLAGLLCIMEAQSGFPRT